MNTSNYFIPTRHQIPRSLPLYGNYKDLRYGFRDIDTGMPQVFLDKECLANTSIYDLVDRCDLMCKIYKIEPQTIYSWHVDTWRDWTMNLLLSEDDQNYMTVFSTKPMKTPTGISVLNIPYVQLQYEPQKFYLLNTTHPHMVINYSSKPRYVLTVAFFHTIKDGAHTKQPSPFAMQTIKTYDQIKTIVQ